MSGVLDLDDRRRASAGHCPSVRRTYDSLSRSARRATGPRRRSSRHRAGATSSFGAGPTTISVRSGSSLPVRTRSPTGAASPSVSSGLRVCTTAPVDGLGDRCAERGTAAQPVGLPDVTDLVPGPGHQPLLVLAHPAGAEGRRDPSGAPTGCGCSPRTPSCPPPAAGRSTRSPPDTRPWSPPPPNWPNRCWRSQACRARLCSPVHTPQLPVDKPPQGGRAPLAGPSTPRMGRIRDSDRAEGGGAASGGP
jgi:hypothetical protein